MAGEGGERDLGQPGRRRVARQQHPQFAPQHRAELQAGDVAGVVDQPDVQLVRGESGQLLGGGQLVQFQFQAGGALGEARQQRGDRPAGQVRGQRGPQQTGLAVADAARGGHQRLGAGQHLPRLGQQQRPGLGDGHLTARALEEADAQVPLQALDALREGRLGHAQASRGTAEV